MKKNYVSRQFIIAGSMLLLAACQHYNNSGKNYEPKTLSSQNVQKTLVKEKLSTDKISANTGEINSNNFKVKNQKKFVWSNVFNDLSDNESQVEVRKNLLMSLSKYGENVYKDAADKKDRKLHGITVPGQRTGIVEMAEYRRQITMPIGTDKLLYETGFIEKAYAKAIASPILAKAKASLYKTSRAGTYSLANVIWKERGPKNIPGRGRSLVVSPTNSNKWYNGTAGGGVWITEDAGLSWRNTTDFAVPNLATSTLAISPNNPNIVYAGTGEPFGNFDRITGSGIVKSTDAGETWSYLANTSAFGSVGRIVVNPTDADMVLSGTSLGVFRSTNGGSTWTKTYSGSGTKTNVQDLKATSDFSAIYGAVNSLGIVKSIDGGVSWSLIYSNTSVKRFELAVSPVDNNRLFLSVELTNGNTGMFISSNAGTTFSNLVYTAGDNVSVLSTQGWYDNVITAHPTDKDIVYVGGVFVAKITVDPVANTYSVKSIASGYDNTKLNTYVHPDQHGIVCQVDPNNSSQFRLLLNNDGGVWYTDYKTDPGETQNDFKIKASGLNTTQLFGVDKKRGEDSYVMGAQDNGSAATIVAPASATSDYLALFGGDGFEVLWNYFDPNLLLFGSQYNYFLKSFFGVQNTNVSIARNNDGGTTNSPFYSKMANANNNPDVVFTVAYNGVWKSTNFGDSWVKTVFNTTKNGTWLGSASAATVKVSVANPDVVWAGSAVSAGSDNTYRVNVSKDNGVTFNKTTGTIPITTGSYNISGLAASSVNAAQAYTLLSVAGNPKIIKTNNYGATWTDITGFSPVSATGFPDVPVHSLLEMPFDQNILWAGTDVGLFETTDGGLSWYLITAFPPVSVWNMKIVDDQVLLATHGRGLWTATIPELSTYVLPDYFAPPTVRTLKQKSIHDMGATATFGNSTSQITQLKVYLDNIYFSTIATTTATTTYNIILPALSEGPHTVSVSGVYNDGIDETTKNSKSFEIINFNPSASTVNLPVLNTSDFYVAPDGNFVVDNLAGKFTYNVLNNVGHPYAINTKYQTYLRNPITINSDSKEILTQMVFTEKDYDFAIVEASKDLYNWIPIATFDEGADSSWLNVSNSAQVTEDKFKNSVLDFPANFNAGDEVAIRFRLTSDVSDTRFGWVIKSIVPFGSLSTVDNSAKAIEYVIAPNPAGESTDLYLPSSLKGNVSIGIYDASGKLIKTISQSAKSKINLEVKNLTKGIYLILVKTEFGNKALKLLKN